jgi:arylsulfatase A-like enzyme
MTNHNLNKQPNILWIGVDQMRADALTNSFVQTPRLDRLRAQSTLFNQAYSLYAGPWLYVYRPFCL